MPPSRGTADASRRFWRTRPRALISRIVDLSKKNATRVQQRQARAKRIEEKRNEFSRKYKLQRVANAPAAIFTEEAADLKFWMQHCSWSFCERCGSLEGKKLLPSYKKRQIPKRLTSCHCLKNRYKVPIPREVPVQLRNLSTEEIRALRPLEIKSGRYERRKHGYRVRVEPFHVKWSKDSVEKKIHDISDTESRQRTSTACEASKQSPYSNFVRLRDDGVRDPWLFEIYSHSVFHGVEAALWPYLYFDKALCESVLEGKNNRASGKVSFSTKLSCGIADYALDYDLLHYQYDRWIFKTVTGAINTAKKSGCSPASSLECKDFTQQYWANQHRLLIDAVRQFGFPTLFMTISPFEWTFPFPPWVDELRDKTGRGPTELPIQETVHIAHVLEQVVRGYVAGKNTNRWKDCLFKNCDEPTVQNVQHYFYRFEFQKRGTLHVHLLLWIHDLSKVDLSKVRADIPWELPEEAFHVANLQSSDKTALTLYAGETSVQAVGESQHLQFHYGPEDKAEKIRAYATPLIGALHCRTDVQSSDGKGMLLKYVASYVSKSHDTIKTQQLYSPDLGAFQAATSFLKTLQPLEPEMLLQLSTKKVAWTDARTKSFSPPRPDTEVSTTHAKYLGRKDSERQITFLQWLRAYDHTKTTPKLYARGYTLVGIKYLSIFNPMYFYQYLAMNFPHTEEAQLHHPREKDLPAPIRYFVHALQSCPEIWGKEEAVREFLSAEAHKRHHVDTVCFYIQALKDIHNIWKIHMVDNNFASNHSTSPHARFPLSPQQSALFTKYMDLLNIRRRAGHVAVEEEEEESDTLSLRVPVDAARDWRRYHLLLGKPGTGKSQVLKRLICSALDLDDKVAFCAPLAILVSAYRDQFGPELYADTLHAMFHVPVAEEDQHSVNYKLGSYDLLVIDEASLISDINFSLLHDTLEKQVRRPLVIIAGDERQQPPLETIQGRTRQGKSILHAEELRQTAETDTLYKQFRCRDKRYQEFLDLLRYNKPQAEVLNDFTSANTIYKVDEVTDNEIWNAKVDYSEFTVLTVSRKAAARVNRIVVQRVFSNETPLTDIPLDGNGEENLYPYKGLKVMITKNLDKSSGVVNGQMATISGNQGRTLLLLLENGHSTFTYPVTTEDEENGWKTSYALMPSYAMTISKSQGATIPKLLLWMDCAIVPKGLGYVAVSRVRAIEDIFFLTRMSPEQFIPVDC